MKRIINVYNDIHLFGVHAMKKIKITFTKDDYHIGDNVDMRGVYKKKVDEAKEKLNEIRTKSLHYCSGNHELEEDPKDFFHKDGGILFTHGDYISWTKEKADKYRSQNHGRGKMSRFKLRLAYPFRKLKKVGTGKAFKNRAVQAARKYGCHTIIMGHRHPRKPIQIDYQGIRIIVLPRGKNQVSVEGNRVNAL